MTLALDSKPKFLWKYFPTLYTLPFLMATIRVSQVETMGSAGRWLILLVGCAIATGSGFRRAGKKRIFFGWADKLIVVFLCLFIASEIWTIQPWFSAQRAISMVLLYGCSFWTLWRYADYFSEKRLLQQILQVLSIVLALNLMTAPLVRESWLAGRFRGIFVNPNNLGIILGLAVPLALSQWLQYRQRLFLVISGVFCLTLVLCGSRSAMLGIGFASVSILVSIFAKRSVQAIVIATAATIGLSLFVQTDFFATHILREGSLTTASNRTYFWDLAKTYIAERPDFGHGFGTDAVIHDYYGVVLSDLSLRGYGVMSSYYGLAVQIGWPLTVCFFGLLWGFVSVYFVKYWKNQQLVSLLATMASGLILCIFEPVIYSAGNAFSFLFWTVFMLAVRRQTYQKRGLATQI